MGAKTFAGTPRQRISYNSPVGQHMPEKTATVFVSTGELSGEMHAAHLVRAAVRGCGAYGKSPFFGIFERSRWLAGLRFS